MQTVFLELIKLSLIGSLFAAAVMLVRLLFPKTPRWIFCLLWGVVALRLVFPLSIESSISLVPDRIASGQIITSVGNEYIGDVDIIRENDTGYRDAVEAGRQPVYSDDGYYVVTEKDSLEVPKTVGQTLYPILSWVWAAGTVSMLIYTVVSFLVLRRKMAEATRLWDNIWQCEQVDSPFVLGFFKPKIYLPYHLTDPDMENVIAHEKAHIHRKDHWWKPIGFILLSIHWFNPVLWLAYVMLCRDIEAACDEKVIKHMEKDEMRAYSTALLNCSVNRRRIAACPLAFGEVGVKERVKTVMNYKKPAFWIVIAAVALCIVVAVCFLTDPKDNGPQVGNPQMLELPGVQWFVTPDELKEALNITEDQIVDENTRIVGNEDDKHYLSVKDLTLFGKEVTYAQFQFRRYPGFDFAFDFAVVMFDEDTDMVKLKEEVSGIYGPAADENDTYYMYYGSDKKTEHKFESRWEPALESYAESGPEIYDLEDNPWQEALDDPDYMVHHWVPESGLAVIPEEVVAWFDYAMDQPWNADIPLQDDEALMEWMDQFPWVTISMGNRCAATITRDARGTDDEEASYYTNNYMEFNAMNLWHYYHVSKDIEEYYLPASFNVVDDPSLLEFPGLKWGMTIDEVKSALNIKEDQILKDEQIVSSTNTSNTLDKWELYVTDLAIFNSKVPLAMFTFIARTEDQIPEDREYFGHTGGEFVLQGVRVFLDEETDMEKLEQTMTVVYGQGVGGTYQYTDALSTGNPNKTSINANPQIRAYNQRGNAFQEALNDPDYQEQMWVCTDPMSTSERIRTYFADMLRENGHSVEDIREWLNQFPWVTLRLVNNTHEAICIETGTFESKYKEYITRNALEYRTNADVCIAQSAVSKGSTE